VDGVHDASEERGLGIKVAPPIRVFQIKPAKLVLDLNRQSIDCCNQPK